MGRWWWWSIGERESLKQSSVQFDPAPSIKQYCSGHLQCNQCGGDDFGGANIILSLASQTSAETCPSVLCFFFYQLVYSASQWFSVLGNPISSDLKTRRNLWKWDRDGNARKIITRVAFQFHTIMSRRPVASLVYYILHNKETGWRYSRRISRDHQLMRGRKLRGTRIGGTTAQVTRTRTNSTEAKREKFVPN